MLYENGFREKLDIDRVSVQLANLQTERSKVMNLLLNGYYGLKVLMGMPIEDQLVLNDVLTPVQVKEGMLATMDINTKIERSFSMRRSEDNWASTTSSAISLARSLLLP
jgi:hypothetical protein